jgi:hypothetical protein
MKIFIPLHDAMLEELTPEDLPVPFQAGVVSLSQFETEVLGTYQSNFKTNSSPGLASNSDALPEISSSTYIAGALLG